jgi:hypothetical protein
MIGALRGTVPFIRDWIVFHKLHRRVRNDWPYGKLYPSLTDRYADAGLASGHYFHQDLLIARRIFDRNPVRHIDVGSRIDGFVAHVASFRRIEVADLRPLPHRIANVEFIQLDLMKPLTKEHSNICDSLSCLHALEHFGLGRYGDRLDPCGHVIGLANLVGMLKDGGILYLSVPIGPQRLEFNSQRVFSMHHLLDLIARHNLDVVAFSYVNDAGELMENEPLSPSLIASNCGAQLGCGIFELKKAPKREFVSDSASDEVV